MYLYFTRAVAVAIDDSRSRAATGDDDGEVRAIVHGSCGLDGAGGQRVEAERLSGRVTIPLVHAPPVRCPPIGNGLSTDGFDLCAGRVARLGTTLGATERCVAPEG
jgi:hypothetical protein